MFSSLILWVALAQVPAGPSAVSEATRATLSPPSERRKADLQRLVERRRERRARAAAARLREREEERRTAELLAPVIAAQHQEEAARLHLQAQQARKSQVLYPYGYPWFSYPWWRPSGPILLGPFPEPMPQPAPLPVNPPSP